MTLPDLFIGWCVVALVAALLWSAALRHLGDNDHG